MTQQAAVYGAGELKLMAHRFWMYGFALSLVLHALALFFVRDWVRSDGPTGHGLLPDFRLHQPPALQIFSNRIACVAPLPSSAAHGSVRPQIGVPVPVPESPLHQGTVDPLPGPVGEGGPSTGGEPGVIDGPAGIGDPGVTDDQPVPFESVERPPVLLHRGVPVYPAMAVKAGLTGRVAVRMLVDREGRVKEQGVFWSTDEVFNEAALTAAKEFRFTPACMNRGPVSVWVTVSFVFALAGAK